MGLHRVGHDWSDLAAVATAGLQYGIIYKKIKGLIKPICGSPVSCELEKTCGVSSGHRAQKRNYTRCLVKVTRKTSVKTTEREKRVSEKLNCIDPKAGRANGKVLEVLRFAHCSDGSQSATLSLRLGDSNPSLLSGRLYFKWTVLRSLRKTFSIEDSCLKEAENVQLQVSCFCLLQSIFCPYEFTVILVEAEFKGEDSNSLRKGRWRDLSARV